MADNHFDLVLVWDNLGGAVRINAGGKATVTDPATGALVTVVQDGQPTTVVTADENGRVSFVAQQGLVKLTSGGLPINAVSAEQATAGAANAAAAQDAQVAAESARDDAQTARDDTYGAIAGKVDKGALVVNVKDYGATGDGATDDTTAIVNAHADAVSLGRTLYFPKGTYKCGTNLTCQSIGGDGRERSIISYTGTGNAIDVPAAGVQSYHRRIVGLTIKTSTGVTGLHLDAVASGHFENLLISGFSGQGVWLRSTAGLPAQCLYNVFIDVTVQAAGSYAYRLDDISNENWFTNCRVNGATRGWQVNSGNHNVWMAGAMENCTLRAAGILDPGTGQNETRGCVVAFTRFETNVENVTIFANVQMTAIIANRMIGGTYTDNGTGTIRVDPNTGAFQPGRYATASRPTAASVGVGGMIYDTTLGKPIWSTGSAFKDAAGTTV